MREIILREGREAYADGGGGAMGGRGVVVEKNLGWEVLEGKGRERRQVVQM